MRHGFRLLIFLSLVASVCAVEPSRFRWVKPLDAPAGATRTIGRFELDEDIFDGTQTGFAAMRVLDGNDAETPFLVRSVYERRKVVSEHAIGSRITGFELLPDNRYRVTAERTSTSAPRPATILVLESSQDNYEKLVTVRSSDDGESWTTLVEGVPVYDYSKYLDLRRDRVRIPADTGRYYRLEVSNIMEEQLSPLVQIARETKDGKLVSRVESTSLRREDFRIDRVRIIESRETWTDSGVKQRDYPVAALSVTQDAEKKVTVVEFRTRNVPVRELRFDVANTYFSRTLTVQGHPHEEGSSGWVHLTRATLQRVPGGHSQRGHIIKLPSAWRYRRYRATIHNLDSPALDVVAVTAKGDVQESVFLCQEGRSYRVLYGGEDIAPPRYDIQRVVRGVGREEMDLYELGAREPQTPFRGSSLAWLRSGKLILVPAAIAMVAVLIWLIAKSAKHIDTSC